MKLMGRETGPFCADGNKLNPDEINFVGEIIERINHD